MTFNEAAQTYRDNHHWVPLRLQGKSPECMGKGWRKRTLADPVPEFEEGDNIGFALGAPSGGVVRVDRDYTAIKAVTEILFPEASLVFGRKSSPGSGCLYNCKTKTKNFRLPSVMENDPRLPRHGDGKPKLMVLQILSTGAQTMAPPSIHPDNGEEIVWESPPDAQIKELDANELIRRAGIEAFLMAVRQFWPARGARNEAVLALGRVLLEALATRYPDDDERISVVDELVVAVAEAGGDEDTTIDDKYRARATLEKMRAGEETTGMPTLIELLELPQSVGKTFRKWLGLAVAARLAALGLTAQGAQGTNNSGVSLTDFNAYMPQHVYIFTPTGEPWPGSSVNSRLGSVPLLGVFNDAGEQVTIPASVWLDRHRPVEQMTWVPGLPMLIEGRLFADGGWIERTGVTCFNLYRPPTIEPGDPKQAAPWLRHCLKVYGKEDVKHMVYWFAHRSQHPDVKINHGLVLGGKPGIGKDTILEPVKYAIGPWNFVESSPSAMLGEFNPFVKSVVLRISEARDLGEFDRFKFYDHMKVYLAAPPDVLSCNEKYLRRHSVWNCCGVILTTNHKTDGIYLPADDRRHYVAWSDRGPEDFEESYWNKLWGWYANGGLRHVAAYLRTLDISSFDAKAGPRKTLAFWAIVDANRAPEEADLADALDLLGNPAATTLKKIIECTPEGDFKSWLKDRRNRRTIPHRLEQCGYVPARNDVKDGLWRIDGARMVVYAKKELSLSEQLKAARNLTTEM